MIRALITGGFGFLGSHLTEELLATAGTSVHVVDNLSTSPLDIGDFLSRVPNREQLTYDICSVEAYFTRGAVPRFDQVFHLASPVGPAGVLSHAGNMIRQIVDDTYRLVDYSTRTGARLLDVSTSEIYGGGQSGYCSESTPKIVPARMTVRLEYAIGKLAAECAIVNTCEVRDLSAVIVRPFNIAGPRQSPRGGFVLPRFIQQASTGQPLTVFGDGGAIRAFTHVKDMVSGILLVMQKGARGEAYNIGNPHNRITILELAKKVIATLNSAAEIAFVDPKSIYGELYEEANDEFPDAEKAMRELGWEPQRSIEETIRDAAAEYQRQKDAGVLRDTI
jgi:UDP-glucose 4-epimerase